MHQVVQEHLPVGEKARSVEDGLALKAQFPVLLPRLLGRVLERGADLFSELVKGA